MNARALQAAEGFARWRADPLAFVREVIGAEPDDWQADVLRLFPEKQRIALACAKGPGKSTLEAWCNLNFLATRPHPKMACTSISGDNLRDNLWAEFAKWIGRSQLLKRLFRFTSERICSLSNPETWFISARTWPKDARPDQQANTLAGLHGDYVMITLDESGGIPEGVMAAAEAALATGIECKLMQGGNTTHPSGPLYNACTRDRSRWHVVEVDGDPDNPKRSPRISEQWARELIQTYGPNHPYVLVNVFAKFPPAGANNLLGANEVKDAAARVLEPKEWNREAKVMGVDVARYGDDRSVMYKRQGRARLGLEEWREQDLMFTVGKVSKEIDTWKPDTVFVDSTGLGAGVVDRLHQIGYDMVIGIDSASKPITSNPRFANRRAEMWWTMAAWVRAGGCIPDDPELRAELVGPTFSFDRHNAILVESKADLKKRGLPSPDKADALALTFALPVFPKEVLAAMGAGKVKTEYNPYAELERDAPHVQTEYDPYAEGRR